MASGLGVTVDPAGEPGSAPTTSAAQSETIADNPSTIVQSTAIQTLDQLLTANWTYDTTFSVSTSMPPGTIVHVKPIHPGEWNWQNKIVSSLFNVWTGSGCVRYRPVATAWYGGSIRVGYVPPSVSLSELRKIPLQVLTTFPNRDIDPKNTNWVDFRPPDQREYAYHYMKKFDSEDRTTFGGYVIFYVAARLITQAPEFTTIQFITETKGGFMYDQPNPGALDASAQFSDPVALVSEVPLHLQTIPDCLDVVSDIQVVPSTIQTINCPGFTITAPSYSKTLEIPGFTCTQPELYNAIVTNKSELAWMNIETGSSYVEPLEGSRPVMNVEHKNATILWTPQFPSAIDPLPIGGYGDVTELVSNSGVPITVTTQGNGQFVSQILARPYRRQPGVPINFGNVAAYLGVGISPMATGESIVVFSNQLAGTFSTQTRNMREIFPQWDERDLTTSWLYNIVGKTGIPLLTIRLNPNGVFTTNATTAPTLLPAEGLTMRFLNTLPISSPLPSPTLFMRNIMYDMRKLTLKGAGTAEKLELLSSIA